MFKSVVALLAASIIFPLAALAAPAADAGHTSAKRAFNLPPSADLTYAVKAKHSGLTLSGNSRVRWTAEGKRYDVAIETKANLLGTMLASHSEGAVNEFGLAPQLLTEKRFRKPPHTVTFGQADRTIRFSESATTYPIKGGEQDRTSITWQIVSIARGAPKKVRTGAEWTFFVAGRKEAESWTFRVIGQETLRTPMGEVTAIHISKLPSQSREQQQLDLWLAPAMEWYPVRMLFSDSNGVTVDQVVQNMVKRGK